MTEFISFNDEEMNKKSGELRNKGFLYSFDRDIYYNVGTQTVTSFEYVQDHRMSEIEKITSDNQTGNPRLYLNHDPQPSVRDELYRIVGSVQLGTTPPVYLPTTQKMQPLPIEKTPSEKKISESQDIEQSIRDDYERNSSQFRKLLTVGTDEINYLLRGLKLEQKGFEKIEIEARIKGLLKCLGKLKKQNEANILTNDDCLFDLNDIAGIRIKVFPNEQIGRIGKLIEERFPQAAKDHASEKDVLKYFVELDAPQMEYKKLEIQVVPYLLAGYWDVEHDVVYKPQGFVPSKIQQKKLDEIHEEIEAAILKAGHDLNEAIKIE